PYAELTRRRSTTAGGLGEGVWRDGRAPCAGGVGPNSALPGSPRFARMLSVAVELPDANAEAPSPHGRPLLLLEQDLAQLVLLARLEDREHLVSRLQLGRADGDLGLAVAHDGDQPRPLGQRELLDALAG